MADQKFFACFEISLPVTSTTTEPLRRAGRSASDLV